MEDQEKQAEQPVTEANAEENMATANDSDESMEKELTVEEKYAELEKKYAEVQDQYLRKVADFDNYRKRMMKEKQDAFDYANTAILTDLVTVLDDFDRGITATTDATDAQSVVEGIKMINKQMHSFLESKYNLISYAEKGDVFDPHIHEAIASEQIDTEQPVCAEVYLKGYKLKERVIRPAKVMVHMPKPAEENK